MKLFKEKKIAEYFKTVFVKIKADLENMNEKDFLAYDPKELAKNKVESSKLNHLEIDLKDRSVDVVMVNISGRDFPQTYDVERNKSYPCARVDYTYNLPVQSELLSYSPSQYQTQKPIEARIENSKFVIQYQTLYGNENLSDDMSRKVKGDMLNIQEEINRTVESINLEIDEFNRTVGNAIAEVISQRRIRLENKGNQNNDLNNF